MFHFQIPISFFHVPTPSFTSLFGLHITINFSFLSTDPSYLHFRRSCIFKLYLNIPLDFIFQFFHQRPLTFIHLNEIYLSWHLYLLSCQSNFFSFTSVVYIRVTLLLLTSYLSHPFGHVPLFSVHERLSKRVPLLSFLFSPSTVPSLFHCYFFSHLQPALRCHTCALHTSPFL